MAETFAGEGRGGLVVFEGSPPPLPEGTTVRIERVDMEAALGELSAMLMAVAGKASGLPTDLAENHDHYLHGTPKRTHPVP
ncbi:MAG: hypothetical protein ACLQU5_10470 [Isosphaeraceae bacterium]